MEERKYTNKEWLKKQFEIYETPTEVSRQTGYPRTCITRYATKYNIYSPIRNRVNKIYVNENYFEVIDTPSKAYFLGFIMADGNVNEQENNRYRFNLKIKSTDDDIIKKLCTEINYPIEKIYYRIQTRKGTLNESAEIQINDQAFCKNLMDKGIVIRKTGKEFMPDCNGYELDFIRGFIDGDGWIYHYECATGDRFTLGCCSTSSIILTQIQEYIEKNIGIQMNISKDKTVYKCENSSKYKVFKLLNRIYYENCLSLDRKNQIAQIIKKQIYDELF